MRKHIGTYHGRGSHSLRLHLWIWIIIEEFEQLRLQSHHLIRFVRHRKRVVLPPRAGVHHQNAGKLSGPVQVDNALGSVRGPNPLIKHKRRLDHRAELLILPHVAVQAVAGKVLSVLDIDQQPLVLRRPLTLGRLQVTLKAVIGIAKQLAQVPALGIFRALFPFFREVAVSSFRGSKAMGNTVRE